MHGRKSTHHEIEGGRVPAALLARAGAALKGRPAYLERGRRVREVEGRDGRTTSRAICGLTWRRPRFVERNRLGYVCRERRLRSATGRRGILGELREVDEVARPGNALRGQLGEGRGRADERGAIGVLVGLFGLATEAEHGATCGRRRWWWWWVSERGRRRFGVQMGERSGTREERTRATSDDQRSMCNGMRERVKAPAKMQSRVARPAQWWPSRFVQRVIQCCPAESGSSLSLFGSSLRLGSNCGVRIPASLPRSGGRWWPAVNPRVVHGSHSMRGRGPGTRSS